jgi:hypothetical protein
MPRPVRNHLAGTIAAIPLWLIASGPATSQSTVDNNQVQLGDVFAGQQLNVVTASQGVAVTTATGNAFIGSVNAGDLAVTSSQSLGGAVGARGIVDVGQYLGSATSITAATGNTGDADISSGGTLSGGFSQSVGPTSVSSVAQLNAGNAQVGQAQIQNQAIANSQGFAVGGSALQAGVSQSNASSVTATGTATIGYLLGGGVFFSAAVGNNVTSVGVDASQSLGVAQANTGPLVQAVQTTNIGNGNQTLTNATASANNVNIANTHGPVAVAVRQDNQATVLTNAQENTYQWGAATVTAQSVGNSTVAQNFGGGVALDNVQLNETGGVSAFAGFSGGTGWDETASSTAMGNAATGFSCSQCGGVMAINNSQTNESAVVAKSIGGASGPARSISGTTTAVGNSGSFYVTSPGN